MYHDTMSLSTYKGELLSLNVLALASIPTVNLGPKLSPNEPGRHQLHLF